MRAFSWISSVFPSKSASMPTPVTSMSGSVSTVVAGPLRYSTGAFVVARRVSPGTFLSLTKSHHASSVVRIDVVSPSIERTSTSPQKKPESMPFSIRPSRLRITVSTRRDGSATAASPDQSGCR